MNAKRQYPYKDDEDVDEKKVKYDLPEDNKSEVLACICFRASKGYVCIRCHQYFQGRIRELCPMHPLEVFPLDYFRCPYCLTPTTNVQESRLTWKQFLEMEDAKMEIDDDDNL